jgi:hypothetical protein
VLSAEEATPEEGFGMGKKVPPPSFSNLHSTSGTVAVSGSIPGGNFRRYDQGVNWFGDFFTGDHLLTTGTSPGPIRLTFSTGPVYGAGLQVQINGAGSFTAILRAYDTNGTLLGTVTANGISTAPTVPGNSAPFVGIRSSLAEILTVEVDVSAGLGIAVNQMDVSTTATLIASNSFFVDQLYRDVLNTPPDPLTASNWVNALNAGTTTRASVATSFFNDPRFHTNGMYLAKLYLGLLQQDPDFAGWSSLFVQMQGGATQAAVLAGFMNSANYQATYGNLTDVDFVTRLYQNILDRAPDPGGLSYWTTELLFGVPRAAVVSGFILSPEFDARIRDRATADLLYLVFLRRTGEPGGVNYWTICLDFGVSLTTVVGDFITSPEYLARF